MITVFPPFPLTVLWTGNWLWHRLL